MIRAGASGLHKVIQKAPFGDVPKNVCCEYESGFSEASSKLFKN